MGRIRKPENSSLPKHMVFNKKGKVYYYHKKGQKDIRLGKTLSEAFRNYFALPSTNYDGTKMSDLIERYMREVSPTKAKSTHQSNLKASIKLIQAIGHFEPEQVKAKHAYQYLDIRAREGAPVRANREYSLWSSIMTKAVQWGIIDQTPFYRIMKNKERPRTRLVLDSEIDTFLKFVPYWMQLYIELKLATGLRQTDMLALKNKDWEGLGGLNVQISKTSNSTGKKMKFTNTEHLLWIFSELKKLNGYTKVAHAPLLNWHIFSTRNNTPYTPDGFRSIWHRCMVNALESGELTERFQERDLRAKAATMCESITQAFELMGHSSMTLTRRIYRRGYSEVQPLGSIDPKGNDNKQNIEKLK